MLTLVRRSPNNLNLGDHCVSLITGGSCLTRPSIDETILLNSCLETPRKFRPFFALNNDDDTDTVIFNSFHILEIAVR